MAEGYIRLHDTDNVVVALRALSVGMRVENITLQEEIAAGHKIAVRRLAPGVQVIKYSQPIGIAVTAIEPGQHVHTHNLAVGSHQVAAATSDVLPPWPITGTRTFMGYARPHGRAGTRNYVGILTSVNCSATVARQIARHFSGDMLRQNFPGVDGVVALTHGSGCAMDGAGEGLALLRRTLGGYLKQPNFSGVLVVGLGCETNQMDGFVDRSLPHVRTLGIQATGGTTAAVCAGIEIVEELLHAANQLQRTEVPVSQLCLGLQCGGSDGFSGISANPALGAAADLLVREGGTVLLSETPEIYGAENLLLDRAVSGEVRQKLLDRIRWWEGYVARNGGQMDNNPSHGNKFGGLTTIVEKSLGAVAKAGTSPLVDVSLYAEQVTTPGLVFMDSPGFDPVSATGQVASGATMMCFTTGRGAVFGAKPTPSLKLATNSKVYHAMQDDMDINCGRVLDGDATITECGAEVFEALLAAASGQRTKSEILDYGDSEFTPWLIGAVM